MRDVHRRALYATAKIALGLLAGCAGQVEVVGGQPAGSEGGAKGSIGPVAPVGPTVGAGGMGSGGSPMPRACPGVPPGQKVVLDPAQFACCASYLAAQSEGAFICANQKICWKGDEQLLNCCDNVIEQIDLNPNLKSQIEPHVIATNQPSCCTLLGNPCGPACGCTVWGPPVPRAVARLCALDELEIAEAA